MCRKCPGATTLDQLVGKGNLILHAESDHYNQTVFVDLNDFSVILLAFGKVHVIEERLYSDNFGQTVYESSTTNTKESWDEHKLNLKLYNHIRRLVLAGRIPQEINDKLKEHANEDMIIEWV